jgi:hypothetical protein
MIQEFMDRVAIIFPLRERIGGCRDPFATIVLGLSSVLS